MVLRSGKIYGSQDSLEVPDDFSEFGFTPGLFEYSGGMVLVGIGTAPASERQEFSSTYMQLGNANVYDIRPIYTVVIPNPGGGGTVGRVRLSDNNSAMPQNRVFLDYNYFKSVPLTTNGVDVNRFTPGFERTFLDGLGSIEMQFPMAVTLDTNLATDGTTDLNNEEFGNIQVTTKLLLYGSTTRAFAAGLGVTIPTADDISVAWMDGTPLVRVANETVHLTPYIAGLLTPTNRTFAHGFLQLDVDTAGGSVFANSDGGGLRKIGEWNDQTFLFVDVGIGHWVARNDSRDRGLSGFALTTELHYTKSISDADAVTDGKFVVGNPTANLDLLNGTVGCAPAFRAIPYHHGWVLVPIHIFGTHL